MWFIRLKSPIFLAHTQIAYDSKVDYHLSYSANRRYQLLFIEHTHSMLIEYILIFSQMLSTL